MSFLSSLKTIGEDIFKGIEIAGPVVGEFIPAAGPILNEISYIISVVENSGKALTPEQLSTLIQTLTAAQVIKQSVAPIHQSGRLTPILAQS